MELRKDPRACKLAYIARLWHYTWLDLPVVGILKECSKSLLESVNEHMVNWHTPVC
jgi:hypothetical protein